MDIDRRALLIGGSGVAAGVVLGTVGSRLGWWDIDLPGSAGPDRALLRVLRSGEANLIAAYDAALAAAPDAAGPTERLAAVRQHHLDHLMALDGDSSDVERAARPGQPDPDDPSEPAILPELPSDPAAWPGYFAELEDAHASITATGARIAAEGELARLAALILASETGNVREWANG